MKSIQKYRFSVQIGALILTAYGFFINFKITMFIIMGLTLLAGPFHCGWLCPLGFLQDIFSKLGRQIGIKKRAMPRSLQKVFVYSRYLIFALVMLVGADWVFTLMTYDPRSNFNNALMDISTTTGAFAIVVFFAFTSLIFERPFCNYFCYEGAKYGLLSIFRIFSIRRDTNKCVNCKKCDAICPMHIQVSQCQTVKSPQCINCFACITTCPVEGTLQFGFISTSMPPIKKPLSQVMLLIIIFTGFTLYHFTNDTHLLNNVINSYEPNVVSTPSESLPMPSATEEESQNPIEETQAGSSSETQSLGETPQVPSETESNSEDVHKENEDDMIITGESANNLGDATGIADGIYTGEGQGYRGKITTQVTVKDEQIVSIIVVDTNDDTKWFNRAYQEIPDRIIEAQNTSVDLVSGATFSSQGIRDSVKDALNKAK